MMEMILATHPMHNIDEKFSESFLFFLSTLTAIENNIKICLSRFTEDDSDRDEEFDFPQKARIISKCGDGKNKNTIHIALYENKYLKN